MSVLKCYAVSVTDKHWQQDWEISNAWTGIKGKRRQVSEGGGIVNRNKKEIKVRCMNYHLYSAILYFQHKFVFTVLIKQNYCTSNIDTLRM